MSTLTAVRTTVLSTVRSCSGLGSALADLYVTNTTELNAYLAALDPAATSDDWDSIWPELGYADAGEADDALYGDPGILKSDIATAWDSLNGFTGALDDYTADLEAVYATKVLLTSWQSSDNRIVRVRAYDGASSQGEADVLGYLSGGEYIISLDSQISNLDATATGNGLTDSDTLGDLLDVGVGDYDGFVPVAYDQTGNGYGYTQTTSSLQPQIASSGVLEDGIVFDGTKKLEASITGFQSYTDLNLFARYASNVNTASNVTHGHLFSFGSSDYLHIGGSTGNFGTETFAILNGLSGGAIRLGTTEANLDFAAGVDVTMSFLQSTNGSRAWKDGVEVTYDLTYSGDELDPFSPSDIGHTADDVVYLGGRESTADGDFTLTTIAIYSNEKSTDRAAIESAIE